MVEMEELSEVITHPHMLLLFPFHAHAHAHALPFLVGFTGCHFAQFTIALRRGSSVADSPSRINHY
jgi:hypothetical protein